MSACDNRHVKKPQQIGPEAILNNSCLHSRLQHLGKLLIERRVLVLRQLV